MILTEWLPKSSGLDLTIYQNDSLMDDGVEDADETEIEIRVEELCETEWEIK